MLNLRKAALAAALTLILVPEGFTQALPRVSQKSIVTQTIGLTDVTITYSRPGVKGRAIWGSLVPYDQVWRTGANEATIFSASDDVTINGQKLAAGKYSLHTIPGKDHWTLIFNKVSDQWGSYSYDQKQDALRVDVKPEWASDVQEWLMFSFPIVTQDSAVAELRWEKVRVPFTIGVDSMTKAMKTVRDSVAKMDDWRVPFNAANFSFTNGADNRDEQMKWVDRSISLKETFFNDRLKAQMLAKQGNTKDAIAVGEKAIKLGVEKDEQPELDGFQKTVNEWKAKKN